MSNVSMEILPDSEHVHTHGLYQLPVVKQLGFVFHIIAREPSLDLVT